MTAEIMAAMERMRRHIAPGPTIDEYTGISGNNLWHADLMLLSEAYLASHADGPSDTELLDGLERILASGKVGNGIALFPFTVVKTGENGVSLQELGDEDGSNLGDELARGDTLRAAIRQAMGGVE